VWTKDNVTIPGATNATYTLAETPASAGGVYQAKVSNYLGTATSGTPTITVNAPLGGSAASILSGPADTTVLSGQPATLTVQAAGTPPLSYQWKLAGSPITGATRSTLSLSNVTTPGAYSVDVTAQIGGAATASATVNVITAQAGLSTAQSGYVEGNTVTLQASLTYTGSPVGLAYSLVLPPGWSLVSSSSDAQVKPAAGSTDTLGWAWSTIPASPATLAFNVVLNAPLDSVGAKTITGTAIVRSGGGVYELPLPVVTLPQVSAPRIVSQPASRVVGAGTGTILAVVASGQAPFTYAWTRNGQPLSNTGNVSGADTATLSLANVGLADVGTYQCTVTNAAGTAVSSTASLTVVSIAPGHALGAGGYLPGGTINVTNTLTHTDAAGVLTWSVLLPSGWNLKTSSGDEGALRPTAGTTDLLEWTWLSLPASPFTFGYVLNTPEGSAGDKQVSALVSLQNGETAVQITAKPDPLIVPQLVAHSADVDRNLKISLLELTRVIELYNTRNGTTRTGCYGVQIGTEDGYVAAPTRPSTEKASLMVYHSADSNRDGKVSLLELTRVIELYNTRTGTTRNGQYKLQPGTEDGFAPNP
jgi:Immunoglobulin I-set domain